MLFSIQSYREVQFTKKKEKKKKAATRKQLLVRAFKKVVLETFFVSVFKKIGFTKKNAFVIFSKLQNALSDSSFRNQYKLDKNVVKIG